MTSLTGKTVLVTGGTGFIGKALCKTLIDEGASLLILTRKPERLKQHTHMRDFSRFSDIPQDAKIDIVINLAGEPVSQRWSSAVKEKIIASRIALTNDLAHFLQNRPQKPELVISGSAIGYYGTDGDIIFDEKTPPASSAKGSFAAQLCSDWEKAAEPIAASGIRTILLRIGVVLEKDGGMLKKMYLPFFMGLGGPIGHGRQWLSWIHREDLIGIILFCIEHRGISGAVNAVAPNAVRNSRFSRLLAAALGRPAFLPMPSAIVKLLFGDMGEELMLRGQHISPARLRAAGFQFKYQTLEQSLKSVYG